LLSVFVGRNTNSFAQRLPHRLEVRGLAFEQQDGAIGINFVFRPFAKSKPFAILDAHLCARQSGLDVWFGGFMSDTPTDAERAQTALEAGVQSEPMECIPGFRWTGRPPISKDYVLNNSDKREDELNGNIKP